MTVENAVRTIRSDPAMVQAGFQCGLSREPDLGSGRNSFFWLQMSTMPIEIIE
jgi:hypothetical protein